MVHRIYKYMATEERFQQICEVGGPAADRRGIRESDGENERGLGIGSGTDFKVRFLRLQIVD